MPSSHQPNFHEPRASRARHAPRPRALTAALAAFLLIVAALATTTALSSTPARAAAPRVLTVTPATGLGNQVVLAQWSGFTPTVGFADTVTLLQCKANPQTVDADRLPTTVDDCLTATPFPNQGNEFTSGVTQSDGTGSAFIEILPAAQNPTLNCSQSNPCTLLAYENNGTPPPTTGLPTTAAVATLNFAKSLDDCPPVTSFDVRAEGEASAAPLMYSWAANLCTANPKLILDYTELSSISGRQDFLNKLIDVGVTTMPATADELAASPGYPKYTYAPVDLNAVVVVYNMVDPKTGKRITDLTLSPRLVARIISNTELSGPQGPADPTSFWSDPELNALNLKHTWPTNGLSQPLLRAEQNDDTYITTDWLAHDPTAEKFLQGDDPFDVPVSDGWKDVKYPTNIFENLDSSDTAYVPIQGEHPVARKVFYGVKPAESAPTSPKLEGFVGIVDLATAERYQLPMAKIINAAGVAVAPDAAGIAAGYKDMKVNPDGITKYPNFASTDPAAYPLVKVDYAMLPTTVASATQQTNLKNFLAYVDGAGQTALPIGYPPLPADLLAQDHAAAAKITVAKPAATTPPPKTPTTTVPAPTTTTPPVSDLGNGSVIGSSDVGSGDGPSSTSTPPVASVSPPTKTKVPKPTPAPRHKSLAQSKPVVEIADTGERFGLPVIVGLALLAGIYPLGRRGRPWFSRAMNALRARRRRGTPPTVGAAS